MNNNSESSKDFELQAASQNRDEEDSFSSAKRIPQMVLKKLKDSCSNSLDKKVESSQLQSSPHSKAQS